MTTATLVEVHHALLAYFFQDSLLQLPSQLDLIKFECTDANVKMAMIVESLKVMATNEMVKRLTVSNASNDSESWVLTRPLGTYEQTVTVGYRTAVNVADVINNYCKANNILDEECNAGQIRERDIQKLTLILDKLLYQAKATQST